MFRRILAATDFSELGNAAAFRAAGLSHDHDAAVFFVHALPGEAALRSLFRDVSDAVIEDFRGAAHEQCEALSQRLREVARRPVAVECMSGSPHRVIAQAAEDYEVDLVVAGAHGQDAWQQLFLGGTLSRLMATLPCPLLISRRPSTETYSRVFAAVDLGPHSAAVLLAATGMTRETVTTLHVAHFPHAPRLATSEHAHSLFDRFSRELEADRDAALARLVGEHPQAARLQGRLLTGSPTATLLDTLEREKADLLVIGRHAGSRRAEQFLGSVPKFLAYHAPCDLLLI